MYLEDILKKVEQVDNENIDYFEILGTDRLADSHRSFPEEYFKYREAWVHRPLYAEPGDFPLHVDIESTNRCNLRCSMCTIDFDNMRQGDMDMGIFEKIIKEGGANHLPSIKLNMRGEPTLNQNLVEMVRLAKQAGILEVQFNTNGVAANERLAQGLIEAGLDRIKFSIDAATLQTYESIRSTSYERVVNNVRNFVRIRDESAKVRPVVQVQMVYMIDNKDEVVKYVQLWQNIVNRIGFDTYRSKDKVLEDGRRVEPLPRRTVPCAQLWQRLGVTFDGNIVMCCGDHKVINPLGNIKTTTLKEAWHSDLINKYRRLHLEDRSQEIKACSICEVNRTDENKAKAYWEKIRKNVHIQV